MLTRRQRQYAELLIQGLPYKMIADRMGITERTLEHYNLRVRQTLGVPRYLNQAAFGVAIYRYLSDEERLQRDRDRTAQDD